MLTAWAVRAGALGTEGEEAGPERDLGLPEDIQQSD